MSKTDRVKFLGKLGAFCGGLAGSLLSSSPMLVPLVGHVIVLGPFVATLLRRVQGAVLGGAKDSVLR
jgi:hypothetical protein